MHFRQLWAYRLTYQCSITKGHEKITISRTTDFLSANNCLILFELEFGLIKFQLQIMKKCNETLKMICLFS